MTYFRSGFAWAGFAAAAIFLAAPAAHAEIADCEIIFDRQALLVGDCEFVQTDADGSFEIEGYGITATVLVDPDARTGRAFYENNTGLGVQGNFVGDVTRDGACWGSEHGRICAWARPDAGAGAVASGGVYGVDHAQIGGWDIDRYTYDAQGRDVAFCHAMKITGVEEGVRLVQASSGFSYGFVGYATAALGDHVPVTYWFDNYRRADSHAGVAYLEADPNGFEWLMFEPETGPGGMMDRFMNYGQVHFAYIVDGQEEVLSFPLEDSNAAIDTLVECASY